MSLLVDDLTAMVGVWHDRLVAYDVRGTAVDHDPHGGIPGPFPYENLVYVDFDGRHYLQTNVTIAGRDRHVRTFEADVDDGVLEFRPLGPDAPVHVGVSGGPGLIWFVPRDLDAPGLARYAEPDLIRLDTTPEREGRPARRWRTTVLWRDARLVRPMLVEGERLTTDTGRTHPLDPRGPGPEVHGSRSTTRQYVGPDRAPTDGGTPR